MIGCEIVALRGDTVKKSKSVKKKDDLYDIVRIVYVKPFQCCIIFSVVNK